MRGSGCGGRRCGCARGVCWLGRFFVLDLAVAGLVADEVCAGLDAVDLVHASPAVDGLHRIRLGSVASLLPALHSLLYFRLESLAHSYWPIVFCIIDPLHHTYYGWYTAWGVIWRHAIDSLS